MLYTANYLPANVLSSAHFCGTACYIPPITFPRMSFPAPTSVAPHAIYRQLPSRECPFQRPLLWHRMLYTANHLPANVLSSAYFCGPACYIPPITFPRMSFPAATSVAPHAIYRQSFSRECPFQRLLLWPRMLYTANHFPANVLSSGYFRGPACYIPPIIFPRMSFPAATSVAPHAIYRQSFS